MKQTVNRRRFVGLLGASGIVGVAGCLGGDDGGNGGGNPDEPSEQDTSEPEDQSIDPDEFDFPPGADETGIIPNRILSGVRDILATTDRYQIAQSYELEYGDGGSTAAETTVDMAGETAFEQQVTEGTRIERLVTPEETRSRSTEIEGDRSGQWVSDSVNPGAVGARSFHLYPFAETTVSTLLDNASLEFNEIVSRNDQQYARYSGSAVQREWPTQQWWDSARVSHQLETPLTGTVSLLLSESGAIQALEYEVAGSVARESRQGRDVTDTVVRGEIQLTYDGLEDVVAPDWTDGGNFREFAVNDYSNSPVYELTQGPTLPGSVNLSYAEFHVCVHADGERYLDTFSKTQDFEVGDRLFMAIDNDELEVDRYSLSGTNPLVDSDWIEISVYIFNPNTDRSLVYHEEFQP